MFHRDGGKHTQKHEHQDKHTLSLWYSLNSTPLFHFNNYEAHSSKWNGTNFNLVFCSPSFPSFPGEDSDSDSDLSMEEERSLSIPSSESEDNVRLRGRIQRRFKRSNHGERLLTEPAHNGTKGTWTLFIISFSQLKVSDTCCSCQKTAECSKMVVIEPLSLFFLERSLNQPVY